MYVIYYLLQLQIFRSWIHARFKRHDIGYPLDSNVGKENVQVHFYSSQAVGRKTRRLFIAI